MKDVDTVVTVEVGGEVDAGSAAELKSQFADAVLSGNPRADLVIDVGRVTFMDSSGAAALLRAVEAVSAGRTCVSIRATTGPTLRALELVVAIEAASCGD